MMESCPGPWNISLDGDASENSYRPDFMLATE